MTLLGRGWGVTMFHIFPHLNKYFVHMRVSNGDKIEHCPFNVNNFSTFPELVLQQTVFAQLISDFL